MRRPNFASYHVEWLIQQRAKQKSGLQATEIVLRGISLAKRGVHGTSTIAPGLQLPALLPLERSEPAIRMVLLANLEHADVLVNDDICLSAAAAVAWAALERIPLHGKKR